MPQPFRVSTGLKDLIGRDLITNEFVAVFELVKNSFDASANSVQIYFDSDCIAIIDDGKGMSHDDIIGKWLFVAYSAKRDGTEDLDYRDVIGRRRRIYAGAKGVGRFSCDRLGKKLLLSTRAEKNTVQILDIDWTLYENDSKQEFSDIRFTLSGNETFPNARYRPSGETGTVLEIRELRAKWDRKQLLTLKRELAKLINPFAERLPGFKIDIVAPSELDADKDDSQFPVNGRVQNRIVHALRRRTTSIKVRFRSHGKTIETTLVDRGDLIYKIEEPNPYEKLSGSSLRADIHFLNRSAKAVFARRMGLPSVQFGSIFLFRNGFRVFPVGQENDDFFGLARRQQQGIRRFLGSRDLIGRVEVEGSAGFDEATSRDQGLIRTPAVHELIDCIRDKCVRRLERYVVDITWKDKFDKDVEDTSRMRLDKSAALITQLVSRLAATDNVTLLEYNPELIRILDEKSAAFEESLKALELLAEKTGNNELQAQVVAAANRVRELQAAEAEAREAERRAEARAAAAEKATTKAEAKYTAEMERNKFLVAAASLDQDTILNLHHQIIMHASDVHLGVKRMMGKLRRGTAIGHVDWVDFLERISFRNSQILTASRFATKGGYKQQSSRVEDDLTLYFHDYLMTISSLWAPRGIDIAFQSDGKRFRRKFRPIEVGILIDNLVSNAAKARASHVGFFSAVSKGARPELLITVADNGVGWPTSIEPLQRVFEKGTTTTDGSGLGLYHVRQVIENLGGLVELQPEPYSPQLDGAHLAIRIPT